MKKPKSPNLLPMRAKPPTVSEKLQQALLDYRKASEELNSSGVRQRELSQENTRLTKIIEVLKEELFAKNLALAYAEGQLQRVDHEDAERAEVVMIEDMRTTKVQHDGGFDVNGPAIPIKKAVLKYDLGRSPPRISVESSISGVMSRDNSYYNQATEKPKHWVNRH